MALLALVAALMTWIPRINMPGRSFRGTMPPLSADEKKLRDELRIEVDMLAVTIGERNVPRYSGLHEAAEYLREQLTAAGYEVRSDPFSVDGKKCENLEVELRGTTKPDEIVIVGGHYDSVSGSPGANDNGSGAAAVLALARRFAGKKFDRTLRFVEFVNEEPPYSYSDLMGSVRYAKECRFRQENVVAMFSIETIGYYSEGKATQQYPFPVGLFYPNTADFIAFVGNTESAPLVRQSVEIFRRTTQFPSEGGALPAAIPGIGWSDHWSFWQQGYPGVMVTDTALFRYPHYHTASDTPDHLDYDRMARVVMGLSHVITSLATD